MNNSLNSDFQDFINNRLDRLGMTIRIRPDYQRENANIEKLTRELQDAIPSKLAINLQDIDDSNTAILNIYEDASYKLGFNDALSLIARL